MCSMRMTSFDTSQSWDLLLSAFKSNRSELPAQFNAKQVVAQTTPSQSPSWLVADGGCFSGKVICSVMLEDGVERKWRCKR